MENTNLIKRTAPSGLQFFTGDTKLWSPLRSLAKEFSTAEAKRMVKTLRSEYWTKNIYTVAA